MEKSWRWFWRENGWGVIGFAALTALGLGTWGFWWHLGNKEGKSIWDALYRAMQLFVLESDSSVSGKLPFPLQMARFLAPVVVGYATVKAVMTLASERIGLLRLWRCKDHVVVCGAGQKGVAFVQNLLEKEPRRRVVLIERQPDNDELSELKARGVVVLVGEATDLFLLRKARVERAKHLVALTGNDQANAEIAVKTRRLLEEGGRRKPTAGPLSCCIRVFDPRLARILDRHDLFRSARENLCVQIFNGFNQSARLMLREFPPDLHARKDSSGLPDAHILVVGFGWMGQSLVLHAARMGHYAGGRKLAITVLDLDAERLQARFRSDYPHFDECVRSLCILGKDAEGITSEILETIVAGAAPVSVCYVCLGDELKNLAVARKVRMTAKGNKDDFPVVACMTQRSGLSTIIAGQNLCRETVVVGEGVHLFPMVAATCSEDSVLQGSLDKMARAVHADYRNKETNRRQGQSDPEAVVSWKDLSEELRDSNRYAADHIPIKLRAIGYEIVEAGKGIKGFRFDEKADSEKLDLLKRMEHNRWVAEKRLAGFRCGERKDPVERTHPCMLPFDQLPDQEKNKDLEAVLHIPRVLAAVGLGMASRAAGGAKRVAASIR